MSASSPTSQASTGRQLNVGLIGIGVGGSRILPAMEAMPLVNLMAGADINPLSRDEFVREYPNARVYASAEEICEDPEVEAVWISTPNRFHAEHVALAARHGKHIIVEKPMALSMDQAAQMVKDAEEYGVKMLAGHTRSYSPPMRATRRIVDSGVLGPLRAINIFSYSDWLLRPRAIEELDLAQGGGVPYRQGPHQVDTVRFIGGGMLRSVRGMTGQWLAGRESPGFYTAYMEFEDGTPATIVHNGNGYFIGTELVPWGESKQNYSVEERSTLHKQIASGTRSEIEDKQERRDVTLAGEKAAIKNHERRPWLPDDLGVVIVSCERGDIRQSKYGLYVYDNDGVHDVDIELEDNAGFAELEELYNSVVLDQPTFHTGAWGMATLEAVLAIMESAKERREIMLTHQVPIDPNCDKDFAVSYLS
jgi:phthalate 4,5-cis-dihydrodiol dehydrogenase